MSACPSCGTENQADARFCSSCGSPLGTLCANCRTPLNEGARFCHGCGNPVEETRLGEERKLVTVFADVTGGRPTRLR